MSVTPSPIGGFAAQFFDNNGVILSGGKIYTYAAGTTTPQASYTSASGVTPHANPIILDSAGRVPGGEIWLTDGLVYKFVIETATSILLGTYDNITGVNSNFVNYTVQEEVITATAGQTVFNLSTINYTPGTNSLTVYIDGVNQYVGDSYLETDSNTVTFTSGIHVGAEVKFTTAIQTTTGAVDASIVSYEPPFTGGVATNVEAKLAQTVSVIDFGADPTGVASSVAAFNAAVANGGTVYVPPGTYKLDGKVTLSVDDTTLWLGANVTLNVSGVAPSNVLATFGAQILVYANNCAIIGSGPSSLIQNVLGTYANTISIVPPYVGLLIRDLTIDGGKSLVTATSNDTFGAGIMVLGYAPTPSDVQATIDNLIIKNYAQYGISLYGAQCNGVKIVNCNIRDIGITAQALSVGAGIVSAVSGSNLTISNNVIKDCKQNGIFVSSAGVNSGNHVVANNIVLSCGDSGIGYYEQANYGSASGIGISQIAVTGNVCLQNTRSGIRFNVDTVGVLENIVITGNVCNNNTYAGIELNTTNTAPNILSDIVVSGNQTTGNGSFQAFAGSNVPLVEGLERSFTPAVRGTTTAGVGTYTAQNGTYVKTGNVVTFQLLVDWSAHTGTGDIEITGFPYAAINGEPTPVGWVWSNGLTITGQAALYMLAGQTYGALQSSNNGTAAPVAMDAAASLRISGTYLTLD